MGGKKTEVKSFSRNVDLREKKGGKKTKVKLFSRNVDLWEKANHGQDLCVRSTKRISGSRKRQRTSRLPMSSSQRFCDKYNRLFSLLNHFI